MDAATLAGHRRSASKWGQLGWLIARVVPGCGYGCGYSAIATGHLAARFDLEATPRIELGMEVLQSTRGAVGADGGQGLAGSTEYKTRPDGGRRRLST